MGMKKWILVLWRDCEPRTTSILVRQDVKIIKNQDFILAKFNEDWWTADILEQSDNKDWLKTLEYSTEGELLTEERRRSIPSSLVAEKRVNAKKKRDVKKAYEKVSRDLEKKVLRDCSIFGNKKSNENSKSKKENRKRVDTTDDLSEKKNEVYKNNKCGTSKNKESARDEKENEIRSVRKNNKPKIIRSPIIPAKSPSPTNTPIPSPSTSWKLPDNQEDPMTSPFLCSSPSTSIRNPFSPIMSPLHSPRRFPSVANHLRARGFSFSTPTHSPPLKRFKAHEKPSTSSGSFLSNCRDPPSTTSAHHKDIPTEKSPNLCETCVRFPNVSPAVIAILRKVSNKTSKQDLSYELNCLITYLEYRSNLQGLRVSGPLKVELVSGSGIFAEDSQLKEAIEEFGKNPAKLTETVLKMVIDLKGKTRKGRRGNESIPENILRTVFKFVNRQLPPHSQMSLAEFNRKVTTMITRQRATEREKNQAQHNE